MAEQVFFRKSGEETSAFVLVCLFQEDGQPMAEALIEVPATDRVTYAPLNLRGDVNSVLRDATEYAALNGFDLRITTNAVEWPLELGPLVGQPSADLV